MFIMSLGEFGDLWDTFDGTKHSTIGLSKSLYSTKNKNNCNLHYSQVPLVYLHVTVGYPPSKSSYCHDGRHLCQDCRDQE